MLVTFDYPINAGRVFHGEVRCQAQVTTKHTTILKVMWKPHAAGAAFNDITRLVELMCPQLKRDLLIAAEHNASYHVSYHPEAIKRQLETL